MPANFSAISLKARATCVSSRAPETSTRSSSAPSASRCAPCASRAIGLVIAPASQRPESKEEAMMPRSPAAVTHLRIANMRYAALMRASRMAVSSPR